LTTHSKCTLSHGDNLVLRNNEAAHFENRSVGMCI